MDDISANLVTYIIFLLSKIMAINSYTCIQLSIIRLEYQYTTIKDGFFYSETIDPYIQQNQSCKDENFLQNPIKTRSCKIHAFMPLGLLTYHYRTVSLSSLYIKIYCFLRLESQSVNPTASHGEEEQPSIIWVASLPAIIPSRYPLQGGVFTC